MYKYGVLVAGNGDTSRANVEALLEDYVLAKGENGVMVIPFTTTPSAGQIWAGQVASANGVDVIIVSPPNALLDSVPKGQLITADQSDLYSTAVATLKTAAPTVEAFIVWSDEDSESVEILAQCKTQAVIASDLRNGLATLTPSDELKHEAPVEIPEAEQISEEVEQPEEIDEEGSDDEEDLEDDIEEAEDIFYAAITAFAEIVADIVIEKMRIAKK